MSGAPSSDPLLEWVEQEGWSDVVPFFAGKTSSSLDELETWAFDELMCSVPETMKEKLSSWMLTLEQKPLLPQRCCTKSPVPPFGDEGAVGNKALVHEAIPGGGKPPLFGQATSVSSPKTRRRTASLRPSSPKNFFQNFFQRPSSPPKEIPTSPTFSFRPRRSKSPTNEQEMSLTNRLKSRSSLPASPQRSRRTSLIIPPRSFAPSSPSLFSQSLQPSQTSNNILRPPSTSSTSTGTLSGPLYSPPSSSLPPPESFFSESVALSSQGCSFSSLSSSLSSSLVTPNSPPLSPNHEPKKHNSLERKKEMRKTTGILHLKFDLDGSLPEFVKSEIEKLPVEDLSRDQPPGLGGVEDPLSPSLFIPNISSASLSLLATSLPDSPSRPQSPPRENPLPSSLPQQSNNILPPKPPRSLRSESNPDVPPNKPPREVPRSHTKNFGSLKSVDLSLFRARTLTQELNKKGRVEVKDRYLQKSLPNALLPPPRLPPADRSLLRDALTATVRRKFSPLFTTDCSRQLVKSGSYLSTTLSLQTSEEEEPAPLQILNASFNRAVGRSGQLFSVDVKEEEGVVRVWLFVRLVRVSEGRIEETSCDPSLGKRGKKCWCSVHESGCKKCQQMKGCDHKFKAIQLATPSTSTTDIATSLSVNLKFHLKTQGVFYLYATTLNSPTDGALSSRFYLSPESKKQDKKERKANGEEDEEEYEKSEESEEGFEEDEDEDDEDEDREEEDEPEAEDEDKNQEDQEQDLPHSFDEVRTTSAPPVPSKTKTPPLLKRDGASIDLIALKRKSSVVSAQLSKSEPRLGKGDEIV